MATNPFQHSNFGAIPFDIYNDAVSTPAAALSLPGGACNFVDLTPGANGSKCGCRRFWSRQSVGSPIPDQVGWCMCNHHACYHDEAHHEGQQPTQLLNNAEQENERPRLGRDPLSPVLGIPIHDAAVTPGFTFPSFGDGDALSFIHRDPEPLNNSTGGHEYTHPTSSMPDTLAWGDDRTGQHTLAPGLPPIPAQCLMPSQTASTTSSVQARYLRPFAGKGLQTLSSAAQVKTLSNSQQEAKSASPTAVGKNAVAGRQLSVRGSQDESGVGDRAYPTCGVSHEMFTNLSDTVGGHEQRLNRLETVSFSVAGNDDCHEKHDHVDLRVTDLESRMEEMEKLAATDNASAASRHADPDHETASHSALSIATSMTSRPHASQDLYSQVQSLSAQVAQLQSALPSWHQPWEVEVVFLPFPLRKLWQNIDHFKPDTTTSGDEWTQMTLSSATLRSQSPSHSEWAPVGYDQEWLLPRACSEKSIADKRLRSRGLIKTISVKGPDARSVQLAIHSVFGNVLREMRIPEGPESPYPQLSKFLGLQSAWIPLRKIHKDNRLRFLSPGEMISTTLWDVQFLSSIMMRSAQPRLFITHPDAYIQDAHAHEIGWSWQRLRELSAEGPDVTESQEIHDGDVPETHWAWNDRFDEAPYPETSLGSRQKELYASRTSHSPHPQLGISSVSARMSPVLTTMRSESPMLKGRRGSRPPNIRTASVPLSITTRVSPVSGRRVVSSGEHRRPSPSVRVPPAAIRKRRQTRSPSYHRFTPRWTASPSPMPLGLAEYQPARGTTPFAYATPHSNAPLQELRPMRSSSVMRSVPGYPYDEDDQDDYDMQIYENDSGDLYVDGDEYEDENENDSEGSVTRVTHNQSQHDRDSQHAQLPEDEPWPGIEDFDRVSDGENIDPRSADGRSDTSSQPSEYPSTQPPWRPGNVSEFHIHEDEDGRPGN
ncbi:hypothetical protein HJFPF1_03881 [Paramyrothecium foliicola]|nr:hypothetical protein HJFPF1_03881 [Paramyrothecium foliicola]